jgi:hypothetical protein
VIYRRPDDIQTQKRGFKTKRDADLFLAKVEIDNCRSSYVNSAKPRVLLWMRDLAEAADVLGSGKPK